MLQDWMLSEEGWTKSKNWARRFLLLSVFAGLISAAVGGAASLAMVRFAWSDLERHYLSTYLWAASPSVLSSAGTYNFVVLEAEAGPSYLATPGDVVLGNGAFVPTSQALSRGATAARERQYANVAHA